MGVHLITLCVCSLGIKPMTLGTANATLYHLSYRKMSTFVMPPTMRTPNAKLYSLRNVKYLGHPAVFSAIDTRKYYVT